MTDLQLAAGLLNASRNASRAREAAEKHLEEARSALRYAREAAAAAADGAQAERERLALEKERFAAEQRERSLRAEAREQQQQARELLADAMQECHELAAMANPPRARGRLLLRLAGLQAKVLILEGNREALTELADKTALRQVRQQASSCIQAFADRKLSPRDPWVEIQAEIVRMRAFTARGGKLLNDAQKMANQTQRPANSVLSHDDWQVLWQRLQDFRSRWPEQLSEMKDMAESGWWDAEEAALDQEWQGLLLLEALVPTETPTNARGGSPEETINGLAEWNAFSRGRGTLQDKVRNALDHAQTSLAVLNDKYLADQPRWQQALKLAKAGNYQQAERVLEVCHNFVRGTDHHRCVEALDGWKAKLRALSQACLPQDLTRLALRTWPLLPHAFRAETQRRRELVETTREWINDQEQALTADQGTDFGREAASALATHARTVAWTETKVRYAVWGRRCLEAVVLAAVASAAVLMALTSIWNSRDERQRADLYRQAGEIAVRRTLRSAGNKLQDTVEGLAVEAERQRQMQAERQRRMQAQAQAERNKAAETDRLRREEVELQKQREAEAEQQRQRWAEQQAIVQQVAQQDQTARQEAEARRQAEAQEAREKHNAAERRQQLLGNFHGGASKTYVYGRIPLNLGLPHGYISMHAGACYEITADNADGTLSVKPAFWPLDGDLHSDYDKILRADYYNDVSMWEVRRDLAKGVRVKPEYLMTIQPQ